MEKRTIICAALSDDADGFAQTQTPLAAGNLTLNGALVSGGVGVAAAGQLVTITSVGNDSAKTFTVTGLDPDGTAITETITGANATTATGSRYFKSVSQIAVSAATADAVTAGVLKASGGVSPTLEVSVGEDGSDYSPALFADIGAGTYTVEMTPDVATETYAAGYTNSASWIAITEFSAKTADVAALLTIPCHGLRMKVTTHTSGTFKATLITR
jgi:hypothetical protein